jgi:O-antigen/teichoic acid export membrane protein
VVYNLPTLLRKISDVALGGAVAQLVVLAVAPILTRLFSAETLGEFAIYSSATLVLVPLMSLALPPAIVLAKSQPEIDAISRLIIGFALVATAVSVGFLSALWAFGSISEIYLWAPIGAFATIISTVIQQRLLRADETVTFGKTVALQSITSQSMKILAGLLGFASGTALILATLFGALLPVLKKTIALPLYLGRKRWRAEAQILRDYGEFPKHQLPQQLLNAAAQALPVLILGAMASPAIAGYYSIALVVLSMPSQVIGKYAAEGFYGHIARLGDKLAGDRYVDVVRRSGLQLTGAMLLIASLPFFAVWLWGPTLFSWIFGSGWAIAGEFASAMAIWMTLSFANAPALKVLMVQRQQRRATILNLVTLPIRAGTLWAALSFYDDPLIAVALFAVVGVVHNIGIYLLAMFALKKSGTDDAR